jgi:hypothetical protein
MPELRYHEYTKFPFTEVGTNNASQGQTNRMRTMSKSRKDVLALKQPNRWRLLLILKTEDAMLHYVYVLHRLRRRDPTRFNFNACLY